MRPARRRSSRARVAQSRHNKHARSCKRVATAGTLTFSSAAAGSRKVACAGRLTKHKKLGAGSYAVTVTATNSSGHATSKALRFTIVKG